MRQSGDDRGGVETRQHDDTTTSQQRGTGETDRDRVVHG